jgi:superfamily II DNA or RNA helicase
LSSEAGCPVVKKHLIHNDGKMLLALVDKKNIQINQAPPVRPDTSLAENALFTGALQEPSMITELGKEIFSADRIDFLVSFIKWSGLRLLMNALDQFTARGGKLRVITTSYLGATDFKAVDLLSKLSNTEVRISYDTERTRLHAKTYVFWRDTGFSTVYIGSSNVSQAAMTSGLEWNIKLSEYDSRDILDKVNATFESYWHNHEFIPFIPGLDADRLRRALKSERFQSDDEKNQFAFNFDINPYYYQQEILDKLKAERELHHSYKNLVIAATGTGKTVMAAFDYRNFCREHNKNPNRLLFVAHRKEILEQSRDCFRVILKDNNFGSLLVGRYRPDSFDHLFVSIQSLNSKELTAITPPDYYDYIVIDEFHHSAAKSYQELLRYYQPGILLGLTATPERADGQPILPYFDGRIAAEMRLYEAIERKLLSPFHYFGVTDSVNLSQVRWTAGKYSDSELENLFVLDAFVARRRVANIIQSIEKYCNEISEIIGIGFCVSMKHAEFMADCFNQAGISSDYLTAESDDCTRDTVKKRLINRDIHFIFVVDLYNEGVDIPEINTVLFLRPTESLTVFLQQLGRGLRLSEGKEALTVLDFVGQANNKFDFEQRYKALLGKSRRTVEYEIKHDFIHLPRGCSIQLEKQAQEYILDNIRNTINNKRNLIHKLQDYIQVYEQFDPNEFFESYCVQREDVYVKKYTLTSLAEEAGLLSSESKRECQYDVMIANACVKLNFANSRRWLGFLQDILPIIRSKKGKEMPELSIEERSMLNMLYYTIWQKGLAELNYIFYSIEEAIYEIIQDDLIYKELMSLLTYRYDSIDFVDKKLDLGFVCPLDLYCTYTLDQILVALGRHTDQKRKHFREGVLYLRDKNLDVFFVTLNKSDKDYSPSTMYHDYAINEEQFHWQSQSTTSVQSPTGQRYINQEKNQNNVLIFVREYKRKGSIAMPYVCLGLADYVSHYGSAPVNITWQMQEKMPGFVLREALKG